MQNAHKVLVNVPEWWAPERLVTTNLLHRLDDREPAPLHTPKAMQCRVERSLQPRMGPEQESRMRARKLWHNRPMVGGWRDQKSNVLPRQTLLKKLFSPATYKSSRCHLR